MSKYDGLIEDEATRAGVPSTLLRAVIKQESGFDPNVANKEGSGALGLGQLMPATAAELGVTDRTDPAQAIRGAADYLRQGLDKTDSVRDALRYYYGGPDTKKWGVRTNAYPDQVLRHVDGGEDSFSLPPKPVEQESKSNLPIKNLPMVDANYIGGLKFNKMRDDGYSDTDIVNALNSHYTLPFSTNKMKLDGYSDTDIVDSFITLGAEPPPSSVNPTDYVKSAASGALSGLGSIAQGAGELISRGINKAAGTELRSINPLQPAIDWLENSQSDAAKKAKADTNIEGSLFDRSTWDMGKDPSVHGIALQGLNAIGQFAPNLAVALVTGGASLPAQFAVGATVGGLQALGAGAEEERNKFLGMTDEQLRASSTLYNTMIAKNIDKNTARYAVAEAAALGGGTGNAIPSAAEGGLEDILVGALTRGKLKIPALFGKGMLGKVATGTIGGGLTGGSEEAIEQVGQNYGSNLAVGGNRPLDEGTLQQFVMGAIAEGAAGAGGGAISHYTKPNQLPNVAPIIQAPDIDSAIKAAQDVVAAPASTQSPAGSFSRMDELATFAADEKADLANRRAKFAQDKEFADLSASEKANLEQQRAELAERQTDDTFAKVFKGEQTDEAYRQREAAVAAQRNKSFLPAQNQRADQQIEQADALFNVNTAPAPVAPNAMQLAMQRAKERANAIPVAPNVDTNAGISAQSDTTIGSPVSQTTSAVQATDQNLPVNSIPAAVQSDATENAPASAATRETAQASTPAEATASVSPQAEDPRLSERRTADRSNYDPEVTAALNHANQLARTANTPEEFAAADKAVEHAETLREAANVRRITDITTEQKQAAGLPNLSQQEQNKVGVYLDAVDSDIGARAGHPKVTNETTQRQANLENRQGITPDVPQRAQSIQRAESGSQGGSIETRTAQAGSTAQGEVDGLGRKHNEKVDSAGNDAAQEQIKHSDGTPISAVQKRIRDDSGSGVGERSSAAEMAGREVRGRSDNNFAQQVNQTPEQSGVSTSGEIKLGTYGKSPNSSNSESALTLKKQGDTYALFQGKYEAVDGESNKPITYGSVKEAVADLKAETKRDNRRFLANNQNIYFAPEFKGAIKSESGKSSESRADTGVSTPAVKAVGEQGNLGESRGIQGNSGELPANRANAGVSTSTAPQTTASILREAADKIDALTNPTQQDLQAKQAAEEKSAKDKAEADKKAEQDKAAADLKETVRQRNEGANQDFELGQSAEDNVSGQKAMFSRPASLNDETKSANFKEWSHNAPLVRAREGMNYDFKTGQKVVVEAFHGTSRPDRVGNVFKRSRATSGPMAFFSNAPEAASSYSQSKQDTSLANENQNYENWFKMKFQGELGQRTIDRAWHMLTPEQKAKVYELAPRVMFDEEGDQVVLGPKDHTSGTGGYDQHIAETRTSYDRRGNPLKALVEEWLSSGNLYNREEQFMDVLKLVGIPMQDVIYDSPHASYPFVFHGYVSMLTPLVTNDIPQNIVEALNAVAKRDRTSPQKFGADNWDKSTRSVREWVDYFNSESGRVHAWTSIPDKITKVFENFGYDGIIDIGGKNSGTHHIVLIPFESSQFKALGNKGEYSRDSKNMMFSRPDRDRANIDKATRRMDKFIAEYERGKLQANDTQVLGDTPTVMQALGVENLPFQIDGATVEKALGGKHRHHITAQMMRDLPNALYDPLMVFDSPSANGNTGMMVLTEMKAATGEPVIAAIHLSKAAGRVSVNEIVSVYELADAQKRLNERARDLMYYRNEQSLGLSTTPGQLDLPDVVQLARDSGAKILTEDDVVKQHGAGFSGSESEGGATTTISDADATALIDLIKQKWKNAPNGIFAMRKEALPQAIKDDMAKSPDGDKARGVWYNDNVYLVLDNIHSVEEAAFTIIHEFRHYGLEGVFGRDAKPLLMGMYLKDAGLRERANIIAKNFKLDMASAVNEAIADMPLDAARKLPGWKKLVEYIHQWLNTHGFDSVAKLFDNVVTGDEITKDVLHTIQEFVRTGQRNDTTFVTDHLANTQTLFSRQAQYSSSNDYEKRANQIYRALDKMGLVSNRDSSRASKSEYVSVESPEYTKSDGEKGEVIKLRVSNHNLPGYYNQPDFNVVADGVEYSGIEYGRSGTWTQAVEWLAERWGLDVPSTVKSVNTQAVNHAQKVAIKNAETFLRAKTEALSKFDSDVADGKVVAKKTNAGMWNVTQADNTNYRWSVILQRYPGETFSREVAIERARAKLSEERSAAQDKLDGMTAPELTDQNNESSASGGKQTDSPAFRAWFGDSRVVDSDGKPLVVYHGTRSDFSIPKISNRYGFFVTSKKDLANGFASGNYGGFTPAFNVMPLYASIQNMMTNKQFIEFENKHPGKTNEQVRAEAIRAGFDGVQVADDVWSVFRPEQLKSAIGNSGTFDATNPDIRFSRTTDAVNAFIEKPRASLFHGEHLTDEQHQSIENIVGKPLSYKARAQKLYANAGLKLVQGLVDQFAPLKILGNKAYQLARMSKGSDGTLEATLKYGIPVLDKETGLFKINTEGGGFIDRLKSLKGEQDLWALWVAALRAEELAKPTKEFPNGRENLFSPTDIATLKTLNRGKMKDGTSREAAYLNALKDLNKFNKSILDIAEAKGIIDPESRKVWESSVYIPFYRNMEDGTTGPSIKSGLVNPQAFKKLKGGQQTLNHDLLANILGNWGHLLSASAKNVAAKVSLDKATEIGVAYPVPADTKGAVFYLENGEKKYFTVEDPFILDAISSMEAAGLPDWAKPMAKFKHYLTMGVTANPTFKIRNLIRDSVSTLALSNIDANPLKNVVQGYKATAHDHPTYINMMANGGIIRFGAMLDGNRADHTRRLIESGVKDSTVLDTPEKVAAFVQKAWDAYNEFGDRSENANRAAYFEQNIANGMDPLEAMFGARDLMDFSMSGSWKAVRFLTQVVPFMNARMQGLYKLGRAAKEDPRRMGYVLGAVSLASIALLLAYKDDDDWKKREDWDRDNYWWFKLGGTAFRIPKPFEVGAVGTIAERSLEYMVSKEMTGKRFADRMANIVSNTFSMSPVPQIVKPLIDVYANKDAFTGRPIESMAMGNLRPEDRYNGSTSELARFLGKAGLPEPGQALQGNYAALSPAQIDHLIRGYFGWLGTTATTALDYGIRPMMDRPSKPAMQLKDTFLAGNFLESLPSNSSRYVSELYDQAKTIEQAYHSYHDALKRGDQEGAASIMASEKENISKYAAIERIKRSEATIGQAIKKVLDGNGTPSDKLVRINELNAQRDRLARVITARRAD